MEKIYTIKDNKIIITKTDDFDIDSILNCGQIFTYYQTNDIFYVLSGDYLAVIKKENSNYIIYSNNTDYFVEFFDLNTDYSQIKSKIKKLFSEKNYCYDINDILNFGGGIRILKQSFLETVIGFVISANNNIKRIINSMKYIRENLGQKLEFDNNIYYSFPSLQVLANQNEHFFTSAGCGYRAKSLVKICKELQNMDYKILQLLSTEQLRTKLVELSGVGGKVADCILLFCFYRQDVFPVDTWIQKIYQDLFLYKTDVKSMRTKLLQEFGNLAGYVQQYLFYYKRSNKIWFCQDTPIWQFAKLWCVTFIKNTPIQKQFYVL